MTAMFPSSCRSPAAGVRLFSLPICSALSKDAVGDGILLDADDPLAAGNRSDVVALREQPGQRDLR